MLKTTGLSMGIFQSCEGRAVSRPQKKGLNHGGRSGGQLDKSGPLPYIFFIIAVQGNPRRAKGRIQDENKRLQRFLMPNARAEKLAMLTAYDYTMARLVDNGDIDGILGGRFRWAWCAWGIRIHCT